MKHCPHNWTFYFNSWKWSAGLFAVWLVKCRKPSSKWQS